MAKTKIKTPPTQAPEDLKKFVEDSARQPDGIKDAIEQYDVAEHDVFSLSKRPKKEISKPDPNGLLNDDGTPKIITSIEDVVRIGIPFQKLIVKRRAAFMNVGALVIQVKSTVKGQEEKAGYIVDAINTVIDKNKIRYKLKEAAKRMMSEKHCAMLFYSTLGSAEGSKPELKMRLLSPGLGDELYPVFDGYGDLTHFGRGYQTKNAAGKTVNHFDVYTAQEITSFSDESGTMIHIGNTPLKYTKLPIIYFSQDDSEWSDVQSMIARLEELISNFGDTNDYNGSPILVAKGIIKGFSAKGERGKVLEMDENADVKYVNWDQAPESIKLEIETLVDLIYTMTQTPNITLKELSGLGASGVSFDRIFMDPQLAAQDKLEGGFGEGMQRMINFIKAAICNVFDVSLKSAADIEVEPMVEPFRINSTSDQIENATAANGGKPVVSRLTSIKMAGIVDDPEAELQAILNEEDTLGNEIDEEI